MSLLFMNLFFDVADLMANKALAHISRVLVFFLILYSRKTQEMGQFGNCNFLRVKIFLKP